MNLKYIIASLCFIALLTHSSSVPAQNRLHIGVMGGGSFDYFQLGPPNPNISATTEFWWSNFGTLLSYRTGLQGTFVELSCERRFHYLNIETYPGIKWGFAGSRDYLGFGLHLKKQFAVVPKRFFLSPRVGLMLGILDTNGSSTEISFLTPQGRSRYYYNIPIQPPSQSIWAEIGFNAEFQLKNGMFFFSRISYSQGLRTIIENEIFVQIEQQDPVGYAFFSRGSAILFQFGLSYPISRIWEGKMPIE